MRPKQLVPLVSLIAILSILASCAAPTPVVVEKERVVEKPVVQTVVVEKPVVQTVVVEKAVVVTPTPVPEPTEPQRGGTLTLSLGPDFVTFDPYYDVTNWEFRPTFFEAPLRFSDDGQFELWLAESVEDSPDGLTLTVKLRKGIKFHNGREVTADDLVWAVERARDESIGHHLSDRFKTCTGATKVDDYTVQITYSNPTPSKYDALARLYLFPKEAAENIANTPVGTGPFKFVEWVPGDHLTAVRFEGYWRKGEPYLDKIVVKPIPDEQSRMVNLLAGGIDLLMGVPLADKRLLAQAPGVELYTQPPGFAFYAFLFNVSRPPFNNTLVRQALNYAVDRDKINQTAFHGEGVMTTLPYAPTSWAYPEDLANYYTFDLDKAKELLAKAGYPNGFKTTCLIRGTGDVYLDMAQVYQQDLAKIGVEMELLPTELPQYWPKLFDSDFDLVSHATGEATVDPSGLFEGAACCRPFRNFFKITEDTTWFPKYKEIVDEAHVTLDKEKRRQLYHDALKIFVEQGWTIPIAWRQQVYAYKDFVRAFRADIDGAIWLNQVWLAK
ncbi:MAG: ABC transporter substrate-binding protein [Anaerolineae bacterium]